PAGVTSWLPEAGTPLSRPTVVDSLRQGHATPTLLKPDPRAFGQHEPPGLRVRFIRRSARQQRMLCQKNRAIWHGLGDGLSCIWRDHSTKIQQNQKVRITQAGTGCLSPYIALRKRTLGLSNGSVHPFPGSIALAGLLG